MSPHGLSGTETRHHPEARTVGVDFGTLSGRAVVVRAPNGAELGASVHAYRHVVIEDRAPSPGAALPPDRTLRTLALGAVDPPRHLLDRHRTRRHGPDASCGNPASA